ncbi:TPA: histidine--tRNA ligase [Candidatus Woesearchaeota archaeon]|nr:histidine--tRNA ligase [Candidatus Woesearchaeota archaeon]HIH13023.1 histidine--tRNA ligase [Candidatus Woesearchaeota archaeon]
MELQTAKGVRDISPQEKIAQNKVKNILQEVFELYGFLPLETPILERYETLAAKFAAGEASDALKETFKLKDQGNRDLGLRFDLTVPLARYVAMNPTLKMPFKRYEMGIVFRDGPIKAGRVRQFWQCDVDIIGSSSMIADAEIIAVAQTAFRKLNLDVIVKVNNRKLLNGILEQAKIEQKEDAIIAIDKLDKIGKEGVEKELAERQFTTAQIKDLFSLIKPGMTIAEIKKKVASPEGQEGIKELEELFSYLQALGVNIAQFDVSLARGLAYYTGTVFEAYLKKSKVTSSLAAGGRWDSMIGKFMAGNRQVPAVGVAFGLEPIMEVLKEQNQEPEMTTKVLVIPIKTEKESLKIVQQLREKWIPASIDLNQRGVGKNLEYASTLGIPFALIIGDNELKAGKLLLRNMKSGEQQALKLTDVVKKLT